MKIGIDVDGVLADFNQDFIQTVIDATGKDLFPPRPFDIPCWDYPEHYGYTAADTKHVWQDVIIPDPTFWVSLEPYPGTEAALQLLKDRDDEHDEVYFITARPGTFPKHQTEVWLRAHHGDFNWRPTVLISGMKGQCAEALRLDKYIDDRSENVLDVSRECKGTYLMTRPWNKDLDCEKYGITRVTSIEEMFR